MEAYRIKRIVILLLALVNLFLLVLLLNFRWQGSRSRQALSQALEELYAQNEIRLPQELDASAPSLALLSAGRDAEKEAAFARALVGEDARVQDRGGGIYVYTGSYGSVRFRASGAFDYAPADRDGTDPAAFCRDICRQFGYREAESSDPESGVFTALRQVNGRDVYNCTLTAVFDGGALESLAGTWIPDPADAHAELSSSTAADALVDFLDYRNASGIICNAVLSVEPVYELQSGAGGTLLAPRWRVVTDTYGYYVDCAGGTILRA